MKAFICLFILLYQFSYSQNKTYYISPGGNNANDGLTTATAWQTFTNVNGLDLEPGDKILLEGGTTFTGSIQLDQNDSGTPGNPVTIDSYGTGKATIYAPNTTALYASNVGGIKISNLIFLGNNSNTNGIYFEISQTNSDLDYIYIDHIEVSHFYGRGLFIGAVLTDKGFNNVSILHSIFHDNGIAGVETFGNFPMYSHGNFTIAYSKFYDNYGTLNTSAPSGNGLIVSGLDGGIVEYCEAYNNGRDNRGPGGGPVGLWVYDAKNITIQYCESHHNKAGMLKDGGGFDIDGGAQNCTIQYCYSHDNEGPGLAMVEYGSPNEFINNTIRYNISQNDARKNSCGGLTFYAEDALHQVKNSKVYNNTVYVDANNLTNGVPCAVNIQSQNFSNVQVSNNIFYATAGVEIMNSLYSFSNNEMLFLNNNYYSSASNYHFKWNGTDYISLNDWKAAATGQETDGIVSMGIAGNPLLVNAGSGGIIGPADGGSFNALFGYTLSALSPLINKGIDLSNMGSYDFFGTPVPQYSNYEIGAAEFAGSNPLSLLIAEFNAVVQTNSVMLQWKVYDEEFIRNYEILKSYDGIHFEKIGTVSSARAIAYSFIDFKKTSNAFYRIRYVSTDGKSGLSSTVRISAVPLQDLLTFYNEGQGLQIRSWSDQIRVVSIRIYNPGGALLYSAVYDFAEGSNNIIISEAAKWKAGVYILCISSPGNATQVSKFVKPL
jgi:hypothetical protein